jgi:hypothetical protein
MTQMQGSHFPAARSSDYTATTTATGPLAYFLFPSVRIPFLSILDTSQTCQVLSLLVEREELRVLSPAHVGRVLRMSVLGPFLNVTRDDPHVRHLLGTFVP